MSETKTLTDQAPWITYFPDLKVLDCTIRDGGLVNDHQFDDDFVRAVYETCVEAGIDTMEIGYKASKRVFDPKKFGKWKFCDEEDIRRIVGDNPSELKLAAMADAGGKTDWRTDILPKEESVLDIIRVATYVHNMPEAIDMINDAYEKGYEVWCNIMAISAVQDVELDAALELVAQSPASTAVVVDSFGSLNPEQVRLLVRKYRHSLEFTNKTIGMHAHNNLQLAFANSIEAIIHGARRVDGTMMGMGRGAGNCPMELLIGLLRNPKFRARPVWRLIQDYMIPMRERTEWGPLAPYIITGQMNQHPRSAIAWRAGDAPDNCLDFYDKMVSDI